MPNIPFYSTYPVAWVNPVNLRASAALPGAGAWDPAPTEQNIAGGSKLRLAFTYTRGGAGGAFEYQVQASPYSVAGNVPSGAQEWVDMALYDPLDPVAAGSDATSAIQREGVEYTATGATVETFYSSYIDLAGFERIRVRARETGAAGTPGTLQITGTVV